MTENITMTTDQFDKLLAILKPGPGLYQNPAWDAKSALDTFCMDVLQVCTRTDIPSTEEGIQSEVGAMVQKVKSLILEKMRNIL